MLVGAAELDIYARALAGEKCWLQTAAGVRQQLPTRRWFGLADITASDRSVDDELTRHCDGPTVDLGCGPGRLVDRLVRRGITALGVDISPMAVAVTRMRGGPAIQRDMFAALPGAGRWSYAILADGNIGIGGDPHRTLRRTRSLLHEGGVAVVEFGSRGTGIVSSPIRLETAAGFGPWYPWATVGVECAQRLGAAVGLRVLREVEIAGRHIVCLAAA